MKLLLRAVILACAALAQAGCGGGNGGGAGPASVSPPGTAYGITQSNLEIAAALYLDSQRTPPAFLADPAPPGAGLVSTHHLQSGELALPTASSYEVCSDDFNQALSWSEQTATQGGTYANLVGNSATSHYFEFDRVRAGTPTLLLRQRVYLCSYLDRSDSSAAVVSGPAGVLNAQPRNAAEMRDLAEYLWHFTSWNNYGSAVLASVADSGGAELGHSLLIATVTPDGISAGCDRIDVLKWRHSMTTASGALQRSLTPLWSFAARQSGAVALDCAAG